MQITRNSVETVRGPAEQSTGDVYIDAIASPSDASRLSAAVVHFTPSAYGRPSARSSHTAGETSEVSLVPHRCLYS